MDLGNIAREWLISRDLIMRFLRELCPSMGEDALEHNAAALIARLAAHEPPILLAMQKERSE